MGALKVELIDSINIEHYPVEADVEKHYVDWNGVLSEFFHEDVESIKLWVELKVSYNQAMHLHRLNLWIDGLGSSCSR